MGYSRRKTDLFNVSKYNLFVKGFVCSQFRCLAAVKFEKKKKDLKAGLNELLLRGVLPL